MRLRIRKSKSLGAGFRVSLSKIGFGVSAGRISPQFYLAAISIASVAPYVSFGLCVIVAPMWNVPDPRIERRFGA